MTLSDLATCLGLAGLPPERVRPRLRVLAHHGILPRRRQLAPEEAVLGTLVCMSFRSASEAAMVADGLVETSTRELLRVEALMLGEIDPAHAVYLVSRRPAILETAHVSLMLPPHDRATRVCVMPGVALARWVRPEGGWADAAAKDVAARILAGATPDR